jgi:hypothetical protein
VSRPLAPWRDVVSDWAGRPVDSESWMSGRGSVLGPDTSRRTKWFELRLSCGHEVERAVRYRSLGPRASRGGTQHRSGRDVLPPPRRVRCEHCQAGAS